VLQDLGMKIAELRRARELTQAKLAELADISLSYVQSCEAGAQNLTIRSIVKLANILRCNPSELLEPPSSRRLRRPGRPRKTAT
jgi:transcriptional regulator with XRE-family HTH domain